MINLILWAILGATTLWIASTIIGGERSRMVNCVICAIGAAVGEIAMLVMNTVTGASGFSFYSFFIGLSGAVIILFLLHYSYNSQKPKNRKKRPAYTYTREQDTYEMWYKIGLTGLTRSDPDMTEIPLENILFICFRIICITCPIIHIPVRSPV